MTLFFIGLACFVAIGLLLFIPCGRHIDWQKNYRQQHNIALYQRQIKTASPELADELSQRLLADERQLQQQPRFSAKSAVDFSPKIALSLWLILCLVPIAYYFSLNRFDSVQQGLQDFAKAQQKRSEATTVEKNDDYILSVQNKLRQDPNNAEAWIELGQAYLLSNEFENALRAYANAEGLLGSKPHVLGLAATALYYQAGQKITPKVRQLLDNALSQDPNEVSSLSLLASDAFLTTDYAGALRLWQQLLDSGRSDINRRQIIQSMNMAEQLNNAK